MRSFSYTAHIERTPEELFSFMTDLRHVTWRSLVRRIDVVGGGPLYEGGRIVSTLDVMGKVRVAAVRYVDQLERLKAAAEKQPTG